jgi:uracil-DNA glycosylase
MQPDSRQLRLSAAYAAYEDVAVLAPLRAHSPLVRGQGPPYAPIMLVGEAPGATEVARGKPFVGKSGQLLDQLLKERGIYRHMCYTTNVIAYRPPDNRTPYAFEIAASRERLMSEIDVVRPGLIITLGAVARRALTSRDKDPVSLCHGRMERFEPAWNDLAQYGDVYEWDAQLEAWMLPTYHPSAALRDDDILAAMRADLAPLSQLTGKDIPVG